MPSGLEIQQQLHAFVKRWQDYRGSERGEARYLIGDDIADRPDQSRALGHRLCFDAA